MNIIRLSMCVVLATSGIACAADSPTQGNGAKPAAEAGVPPQAEGALALPGATVDQPAGWLFRQPSSSMRLAEAEIPGPGGPALLTIFFFGAGGGGGLEANLQRWAGQIEVDPGTELIRATFEVDGFTVTTIDVAGTLLPSRMGGGPSEPSPGSRLLGAVIEGPGGPWFFKLTGPSDTVSAAAPAFDSMLRSIRQ